MSDIIAGKPSNIIGNPNTELILRGTKIKYQQGNRFIDLLKNNSNNQKFLHQVNSINDVKEDGIYLIGTDLFIVINDNKMKIVTEKI